MRNKKPEMLRGVTCRALLRCAAPDTRNSKHEYLTTKPYTRSNTTLNARGPRRFKLVTATTIVAVSLRLPPIRNPTPESFSPTPYTLIPTRNLAGSNS